MLHRIKTLSLITSVLLLMAAPALAGESWFEPQGFLYELPEEIESHSTALSPDGVISVGVDIFLTGREATYWTRDGGLVGLGDIPGSTVQTSIAGGVTNDGVVVGIGSYAASSPEAFRYTEVTGMVGLGFLPDKAFSLGFDVSADGTIAVGRSQNADTDAVPFLWTEATGITSLGLPAGHTFAGAAGISADGTVIVGDMSGVPFGYSAFKWTEAEGYVDLGNLGGPFPFERAQGISGDGQVIVGTGYSPSGFEAFMWTADSGMVGLGDLPGGSYSSWCNGGINYDGSIIVGGSQSDEYASDAFIWDAVNGMRSLKHVLEDEYGLDLTGWNLEEAQGMSDDGMTISGWGYNPSGMREGFVVHLATSTVSAELTCTPESGTIPFSVMFGVTMTNNDTAPYRRFAGRLELDLAAGQHIANYRQGYTNMNPGSVKYFNWSQPFIYNWMIGVNSATLFVEDVTPAPFNQPPYSPAGDTVTGECMVTGLAP